MDRKKQQYFSQLEILTVGAAVIPFSEHAHGTINDQPPPTWQSNQVLGKR